MNERNSDEIIDEFILEQTGPRAWRMGKEMLRMVFMLGRLDVAKFAKDAGVTENEVRRYFGDDDTDETAKPDDTPDTVRDIIMFIQDADNILDSADRDYNKAASSETSYGNGVLGQLNALNHQLNIITRLLAMSVRNGLKRSED